MGFITEQQYYSAFDALESVHKVAILRWDTGTLAWVKFTGGDPLAPAADVNITNVSLAVTGPLTDAQLRASAVIVRPTNYSVIVDDTTTAGFTYVCKAVIGTASSAASWQIVKIPDGTTPSLWADSNENFDNIADNRAALSYG